jgi:hypothetical protein
MITSLYLGDWKKKRSDEWNVALTVLVLVDRAKCRGGSVTLRALSYADAVMTVVPRNFPAIGLRF